MGTLALLVRKEKVMLKINMSNVLLRLVNTLLSILLWVAIWGLTDSVIKHFWPNLKYKQLIMFYTAFTALILILIVIFNKDLRFTASLYDEEHQKE